MSVKNTEWNEVYFDLETTGLNPFDARLITIQVRTRGVTTIWPVWLEGGEAQVIERFLSFTDNVYRRASRFIGYNVLKFDLPFLIARMTALNLLTPQRWVRVVQELNWFDLYQFLGDEFGRFREWKIGLTGTGVETTNDQIPALFLQGKYHVITEYIEDEMRGYELVYDAIRKEKFYTELQALRQRLSI
jgi:hypothetical protein